MSANRSSIYLSDFADRGNDKQEWFEIPTSLEKAFKVGIDNRRSAYSESWKCKYSLDAVISIISTPTDGNRIVSMKPKRLLKYSHGVARTCYTAFDVKWSTS
jgi:hypothetical protein